MGRHGGAQVPSQIVALPDFSLLGQFSFGYLAKLGALAAVLAVFSLLLADFFDTMGTAIGGYRGRGVRRSGSDAKVASSTTGNATAPVLIVVGFLMLSVTREIP